MIGPPGTLLDPAANEVNLLRSQSLTGFRRRHEPRRVGGSNSLIQFALGGLASDQEKVAAAVLEGMISKIEPEVGFPFIGIGTMALKTRVGQNRPDFPKEIRFVRLDASRKEQESGNQRYRMTKHREIPVINRLPAIRRQGVYCTDEPGPA